MNIDVFGSGLEWSRFRKIETTFWDALVANQVGSFSLDELSYKNGSPCQITEICAACPPFIVQSQTANSVSGLRIRRLLNCCAHQPFAINQTGRCQSGVKRKLNQHLGCRLDSRILKSAAHSNWGKINKKPGSNVPAEQCSNQQEQNRMKLWMLAM